MIHRITQADTLYTCPDCDWRAILTSDGRLIQTQAGAFGYDHIGQAQAQRSTEMQQRRALTEQTVTHLRQQYEQRATFDGAPLTLNQLQRLFRYVLSEHMEVAR